MSNLGIACSQGLVFYTTGKNIYGSVYKLRGLNTGCAVLLQGLIHSFIAVFTSVNILVLPIINSTYKYNDKFKLNYLVI